MTAQQAGPEHLITVDVDGYRGPVNVRVDGPVGETEDVPDRADGAPVLLAIHGFSGSMHWWGRVVPTLARRYRVVRVDLLGHGRTGGPAADAPLQARAVDSVLAQLGIEHVTVAGHSFGADVAAELAEHSDRVEAVIIVCQAPDYSDANLPRGKELMTLPVLAPAIHRSAAALGTTLVALRGRRTKDTAGQQLAEQAVADFTALRTSMFKVILAERRDRMARRPLDVQVRASGKPALVLLGGKDHFYGDRSAGRYRAAGAEVVVLPESGHSPLIEAPGRVAELIDGFLTR